MQNKLYKLYESHKTLRDKIEKTGYAVDAGICYGFSSAAIMSLLCGGIEEFIKRLLITYISNEEIENLIAKLKALEQLTATDKIIAKEELKKYHLTEKEREWLAFCDAVMLAQLTGNYAYIFNKEQKIYFQDFLSSSQFTLPLRFTVDNKNDFLDLIASFSGAYQHDDLVSYFRLFEAQIKKNEIESFALHLHSSNHTIAVAFDANTMRWYLIDANKMPPYSIVLGNAEELADFVLTSLSKNENAIFETCIYTKNSTSKPIKDLFDKIKQETAWKSLHEINLNKAKRLDSYGVNWLYTAAAYGHADVVDRLITNNADVNKARYDGATPLYVAVSRGHYDIVECLLKYDIEFKKAKDTRFNLLVAAVQNSHYDIVNLLLQNGVPVNQVCKRLTPLDIAVKNGDCRLAALLCQYGAEVNKASKKGSTPLMMAVKNGRPDMVILLLYYGADIKQENKNGFTPLMMAVQKGDHDVVAALLLENAADVNVRKADVTLLMLAVQNRHYHVAKLLLQYGAEVNEVSYDSTPLLMAVYNGDYDLTVLLCKYGADVNKSSGEGFTPLILAAQNGIIKIVEALLNYGEIQVNAAFHFDDEGLQQFMQTNSVNVQERMIAWIKNHKPNNTQYAMTAQDIAEVKGHTEIVQLLKNYSFFQNFHASLRVASEKLSESSGFFDNTSSEIRGAPEAQNNDQCALQIKSQLDQSLVEFLSTRRGIQSDIIRENLDKYYLYPNIELIAIAFEHLYVHTVSIQHNVVFSEIAESTNPLQKANEIILNLAMHSVDFYKKSSFLDEFMHKLSNFINKKCEILLENNNVQNFLNFENKQISLEMLLGLLSASKITIDCNTELYGAILFIHALFFQDPDPMRCNRLLISHIRRIDKMLNSFSDKTCVALFKLFLMNKDRFTLTPSFSKTIIGQHSVFSSPPNIDTSVEVIAKK